MKHIHLSNIDSTNAYLKRNYKELDNYTFVSSDSQDKGRGRNNREWKSENGKNLLFSLLILDQELINQFKELSILTAYSIIKVLEKMNIKGLSIKWPNDIYVNDKKICGILLEAVTTDKTDCLIIGVGLNVNQKEFVGDYLTPPTSLINILVNSIDTNVLQNAIFNELVENFEFLKAGHSYIEEIKAYDYLRGMSAYALIDNIKTPIDIIGIDDDYSLRVNKNNEIINLEAGEISFHI